MSGIKHIDWKDFEKFLIYIGCVYKRNKGDHRIYWKDGLKRPIIVPMDKSLPPFVIRNNLRLIGMSTKEFLVILENL